MNEQKKKGLDGVNEQFRLKSLKDEQQLLEYKEEIETLKRKLGMKDKLGLAAKLPEPLPVGTGLLATDKTAPKTDLEKAKEELEKEKKLKKTAEDNLKKEKLNTKKEKDIALDYQNKLKDENEKQTKLRTLFNSTKKDLEKTKDELTHVQTQFYEKNDEFKRLLNEHRGNQADGKGYKELEATIKEKDTQISVLQQQKKQMIAINPSTQAFEYIGSPQYVDKACGLAENSIKTVTELMDTIKKWLALPGNDRLTVAGAFVS